MRVLKFFARITDVLNLLLSKFLVSPSAVDEVWLGSPAAAKKKATMAAKKATEKATVAALHIGGHDIYLRMA